MRRFTPQPVLRRELLVADLAGPAVGDLSALPKHLDAHEPLPAVELADAFIGPRLQTADDDVLVEERSRLDRALAFEGDHLGAAHDPRSRLQMDFGPFLQLVLIFSGVDVVAVGVLRDHHPVAVPRRLDVLAPQEGVVRAASQLRPQVLDERA